MTASLHMHFSQINTTKVVQSCPIKMRQLWTKRDFVARKTYSNSPARTVTICDMHKSNSGFCTSLDTLGESNFQSKLCLKTSNFSISKLLFRQKNKVKGCGTFRKFLEWGAETFSDQSKTQKTCNMAVIDTNQWVSMEKVWLFNVTQLFNVALLDGHN